MSDDMALPAGKSCADCVSFVRCRAFIGPEHIHEKQARCDWSPSRFRPRVFDFIEHLHRQRDWSARTFGPGERTAGVVDHIVKELHEVLNDPGDLSEWIDVVILALDGAWRMGFTPEQIVVALVAKQAKNEARQWQDWRTAEPGKAIEHVREDSDANR